MLSKGTAEVEANVVVLPSRGAEEPHVQDSCSIDEAAFNSALSDYHRFLRGEITSSGRSCIAFQPDGIHFLAGSFAFPVSLASRRLHFRLCFFQCVFEDVFDARWARIDSLTFKECELKKAFRGIALATRGSLDFTATVSLAQIDLSVAQIQGDLVLIGTRLKCDSSVRSATLPDARRGAALYCGGMNVHSILMDRMVCEGRVFLNAANLSGILKAADAILRRDPELSDERISRWSNVVLTAIDANIKGAVIFGEESEGNPEPHQEFLACGQINLSNSRIGGDLICTNGKFHSAYYQCPKDELKPFAEADSPFDVVLLASLNVSRTQIGGGVWLDRSFEAFGEVRFDGANIKGGFHCDGATINGALPACEFSSATTSERYHISAALSLDHAELFGTLRLSDGFTAFGLVSLRNAIIHSDVFCEGGTFHACWREKYEDQLGSELERQPKALVFSGAEIDGSVFLAGSPGVVTEKETTKSLNCRSDYAPERNTFRAFGEVRLRGTRIKRNLHLGGGRFGVMPKPKHLKPGSIGGNAKSCSTSDPEKPLVALFNSAKVEGTTFLVEPDRLPVCFAGSATFEGMTTGGWEDSMDCWPQCWDRGGGAKATLALNGLVYESLRGPTQGGERLVWLLHQPSRDLSQHKGEPAGTGFKTQPWEQCARTLYDLGYQREARFLYRMEQRFIRIKGRLTLTARMLSVLLGIFVGHGYRFLYALLWAIWLVWMGSIVADYGYQYGYITQVHDEEAKPDPYPSFHPLLFSLDSALPAGDLRQVKYWIAVDCRPTLCSSDGAKPQHLPPNPFVVNVGNWINEQLARILCFSGNGILTIELLVVALATAWIFVWLRRDVRLTIPRSPRFSNRDAIRLYTRVLNPGRGWVKFISWSIVGLAITSFSLVSTLYVFDQPVIFSFLGTLDRYVFPPLGVSVVHAWMVAETLTGWLLISAVVIGLGANVFRRPE